MAVAKAQEAGNVYTFGQASDMSAFAPKPRVGSTIDNWAPYYIERVGAALDGSWKTQATWGGIGTGMVGIGEITSEVPEEVKAEAMALKDKIGAGEYHPFTGPLNKQDGSAWLAAGETPEDGVLAGMDFFVEGISAELPK